MSDIESGDDVGREGGVERGGDTGRAGGVTPGGEPKPHQRRAVRRPTLVAFGFLLAFTATVLTVIFTGLMLRG